MSRQPDPRSRAVGRVSVPAATVSRDAVFEQLLKGVDLEALPPPPADGPEWRERFAAIGRRVPGLEEHLTHAPIGWFSILEHAATLMPPLLRQGERFVTRQVKEKLAGLRWYAHVELASGEWDGAHPALGVVGWAEHTSELMCSLHGTSDGVLDASQRWLLTLSPRAQQERQELGVEFSGRLYPAWTQG